MNKHIYMLTLGGFFLEDLVQIRENGNNLENGKLYEPKAVSILGQQTIKPCD